MKFIRRKVAVICTKLAWSDNVHDWQGRLMGLTLKDLDQISADRKALCEQVAELPRQMQKFQLLDEDMSTVLTTVNETLELLGHSRRALANIGEAAQAQQMIEARQDGQSRFSNNMKSARRSS